MKELLAEAMGLVVRTEKESYALYRKVAATTTDPAGRLFFERLAQDEYSHIDALLKEFPDAGCRCTQLTAHPPRSEGGAYGASGRVIFEQLRLALLDKRSCIDLYETFLNSFRDPLLCRVFQKALEAARREFRLINAEYLKAEVPACRVIPGRPPRRTHPGGSLHYLSPNRHSQLFFSMQDTGRQSQLG